MADHDRDESGSQQRLSAALPALAAFGALALLVVAIIGLGRLSIDPPEWSGERDTSARYPPEPTQSLQRPTLLTDPEDGTDAAPDIPWDIALLVLVGLLVVLAVIVARRLPWHLRRRRTSRITGGIVDEAVDSTDELRTAVQNAGTALEAIETTGTDAIIEAWLALEGAAASSGVPRRLSQTPSEFTEDLLQRHHADPDATAELRRLYHRARFSPHPDITSADVDAARRALDVILGTLQAPVSAESVQQDAPDAQDGPDTRDGGAPPAPSSRTRDGGR
ncbi:DUF4129 domain-containing protein [Phytoactinopolyspora halotolerans]|uniref:DUF4129 domain-containing protein n=1 Tax=Phytoactinopolyspora halotolerans TaxID=1981512 RepID=A0A6L9S402_9ACTN|nr:DUF4129 domain-containing protein [Phytoactinopolyspora halotolerans]NED99835.1 DUF4129 domain-containing protein [Phytoactinopolyspora halotolerans]